MKRRAVAGLWVWGCMLFPVAGAAADGRLELAVVDATGAGVAGVSVEATSPALIGRRLAVTRDDGRGALLGLPPGDYRLALAKEGFSAVTVETAVRQNEATALRVVMEPAETVREAIDVVAPAPVVETGTPKVSAHLDLEAIRDLPVPRDERGFAQLVSGVNVVPNSDGLEPRWEPASKAGNNYQDRGGGSGSRDNQYYLDGFQMTGMASGGLDTRLSAEAIREQEVVTSGFPAELSGGAGYVVNVLTRSGGPRFEGSASFYFQDPSMYDSFETDDSRLIVPKEDKWDLGATLGGPILRDRLWFFLSGQRRENSDDFELSSSATPVPRSETYSLVKDNGLGKLTWAPGEQDTLTATYVGEQRESSGSRDVNTPPNRYADLDATYGTALAAWQHRFGSSALLEARYGAQNLENRTTAAQPELGPPNTILYPAGVQVPAYLRDLGSSGDDGVTSYDKRQGDLLASFYFEAAGSHALTAGVSDQRWEEEVGVDLRYGLNLTSLAPGLAGTTFEQARDQGFLPEPEYDSIYRALAAQPGSAAFAAADADRDGAVSAAEFAALRFDSRTGNADGVDFLRQRTVYAGQSAPYQKNRSWHVQDEWRRGEWTVTAGVRMEERSYFASDDSTILEMDPAWYPRLGAAWDVGGKGTQRLSLAWGIYPDPIRSSMIRFVGNLTGSIFADEVAIGGDWFAYRERGAARLRREAAFAPALDNEEEEEIELTYGANFGEVWGFLAEVWRREDRNIIEDYDPAVYFNPAVSGDLAIPPGEFGYPPSGAGDVVFFLGNLVGAERVTKGVDLALNRREQGGWSMGLQYSWKDAQGNSNSDAAADLQGDFLFLDPRQPYMYGPLPGSIENQAKLFGSWRSPWKLVVGGLVYWNDGAVYTEATRHRPTGSNILYNYRRPDGTFVRTGQQKHPGYTTVDLRLTLPVDFGDRVHADFYVDVLNALDDQSAIRVEESHNGAEFTVYQEPRLLLEPRRWQVGVRVGFE